MRHLQVRLQPGQMHLQPGQGQLHLKPGQGQMHIQSGQGRGSCVTAHVQVRGPSSDAGADNGSEAGEAAGTANSW